MVFRIISGIVFLGIAFTIPFFFDQILFFTVAGVHTGWVLGTVLIRLLVILLVFFALRQLFTLSGRLSRVKSWLVLLIAILPGFGISFIAPIYAVDYGELHDNFALTNPAALEDTLQTPIIPQQGHALIAFFTTSCPHCKAASVKLGINLESGQKVPVTVIFPGTKADSDSFLNANRGHLFDSFQLNNDDYFIELSGGAFPSVFLINSDGTTQKHWTGDQLNYTALDYLKSLEQ